MINEMNMFSYRNVSINVALEGLLEPGLGFILGDLLGGAEFSLSLLAH